MNSTLLRTTAAVSTALLAGLALTAGSAVPDRSATITQTLSCSNDAYKGEMNYEIGTKNGHRFVQLTSYRLTVPSAYTGKKGEIWVYENASYRGVLTASGLAQNGVLTSNSASGEAYTQQLVAKFTFQGSKSVVCEKMFTA
jgi:hypothetical protein